MWWPGRVAAGGLESRRPRHSGPRARTLATFDEFDDVVLERVVERASTPIDEGALLRSARKAGAPVTAGQSAADRAASPRCSRRSTAAVGHHRSRRPRSKTRWARCARRVASARSRILYTPRWPGREPRSPTAARRSATSSSSPTACPRPGSFHPASGVQLRRDRGSAPRKTGVVPAHAGRAGSRTSGAIRPRGRPLSLRRPTRWWQSTRAQPGEGGARVRWQLSRSRTTQSRAATVDVDVNVFVTTEQSVRAAKAFGRIGVDTAALERPAASARRSGPVPMGPDPDRRVLLLRPAPRRDARGHRACPLRPRPDPDPGAGAPRRLQGGVRSPEGLDRHPAGTGDGGSLRRGGSRAGGSTTSSARRTRATASSSARWRRCSARTLAPPGSRAAGRRRRGSSRRCRRRRTPPNRRRTARRGRAGTR